MPNNPTSVNLAADPEKRFSDLTKKISDLYGTKVHDRTPIITKSVKESFEVAKKENRTDEFLDRYDNILTERKEVLRRRSNAVRQLAEIDKVIFTSEKVVMSEYNDQAQDWNQFATVEQIKEYGKPHIHMQVPSGKYRNNVILAGLESQGEVDANMARFSQLLNNKNDLSQSQIDQIKSAKSKYHSIEQRTAGITGLSFWGAEQAARIIGVQTDVAGTQYVAEYNKKREQTAKSLKQKLNLKNNDIKQYLDKLKFELSSSNDPAEIASLHEEVAALEKMIKDHDADLEKLSSRYDSDSKSDAELMKRDAQGHEDSSTDMMKYRMLSMIAIFTPLGAFSIAGHAFNYLGSLQQFLAPLLDAHKGLGEGLADMVTDTKFFGPFGKLMDVMEVDKAIEGIFNLPLIDQVTDVIDFAKNSEVGQEVIAMGVSSQLFIALGIGATATLRRVDAEVTHAKSGKGIKDKYWKAIDSRAEQVEKDLEKGWEDANTKTKYIGNDARIKNFVNDEYGDLSAKDESKKYGYKVTGNLNKRAMEFLLKNMDNPAMRPLLNEVFSGFATTIESYKDDSFKDENGKYSVAKTLKFLNGDSVLKNEIRDQFLVLAALDPQIVSSGKISKSADDLQKDFEELQKPEKKEDKENKQKEVREKFAIEYFCGKSATKTEAILAQQLLKESQIKKMQSQKPIHSKEETPSSVAKGPTSASLYGAVNRGNAITV